jgi:C4-dicarboxylate transporter DctM subunit
VTADLSDERIAGVEFGGQTGRGVTGCRRVFRSTEDLIISLALAVMVILPLAEVALRKTGAAGIHGSTAIVQHLTLVVGMLGGAIAARQRRLLSLSAAENFLKGGWQRAASVIANGVGAAVSVFLCVAGYQFVMSERLGGGILAYNIPIWVVQLLMPAGFAVIALRMLWRVAPRMTDRAAATALTFALVAAAAWLPVSPAKLVWPAFAVLLLATVLGAPVFTTLGGAALILFWGRGEAIAAIPVSHYNLVVNPSLPAIPLFTLAGYFLAEGGASRRLIGVFQALVGSVRGGPAIVTALVCAFFTSFTGASGVTILALGGLLMPVLLAARYSERNALGLLTAAGSLGVLLPPCLPPILYAIISTQARSPITIREMFLAGIIPGLLLVAGIAWWGVYAAPKQAAARPPFDAREARRAVWAAKWELLLPVVALVGLFGGFATPVEAAALTALYAFFVETAVYRDLKFRRRMRTEADASATEPAKTVLATMTECGLLVGGVLLILGVALGLTNFLVDAQVPERAVEWVTGAVQSKLMFLLLLNLFLLAVGCLMDIYSAIVVVVPILVPIGRAFGIEPVHLGVIFLANLQLGYLTPPVGMNLFLSSYRFGKSMPEVCRAVLPMLLVLLVGVILITYVPALTTVLPRQFGR